MYNKGVSPVLTTCTFIGNSANYGGAISNFYYASPVLTNCTFVGNSANFGGGASNYYYAAPVFTHCNFVNNSANYEGGGIYNISYSSPRVTNSILWFNSPDQIANTLNSTPVITYCDVQGYLGEGNIDASPEFVNVLLTVTSTSVRTLPPSMLEPIRHRIYQRLISRATHASWMGMGMAWRSSIWAWMNITQSVQAGWRRPQIDCGSQRTRLGWHG